MSIQKANYQKFNSSKISYTLISNNVLRNIKCATAYQVYSYLQSQSAAWSVNKKHIQEKFKLGKNKVASIFSYLRRCGLIDYVRTRESSGEFVGAEIVVKDGTEFNVHEPFLASDSIKLAAQMGGVCVDGDTNCARISNNNIIDFSSKYKQSEKDMEIKKHFTSTSYDEIEEYYNKAMVNENTTGTEELCKNQTHTHDFGVCGIYIYKNKKLVANKTNNLVCESALTEHKENEEKNSSEFVICDQARELCKDKNLDFNFVFTKFLNFYSAKDGFAESSAVRKNGLLVKWISNEKQFDQKQQSVTKTYDKTKSESRCTVKFFDEIEKDAHNPHVLPFAPGNPAYDRLMQHKVVFDVRKQLREKRQRREKSA